MLRYVAVTEPPWQVSTGGRFGLMDVARQWPLASRLELTALPTAVPCGRLHTRAVLREWSLGSLSSDGELLVSELLGNAVKASWSPGGPGQVALRLLADHRRVVIEVWDHNALDPQLHRADHSSESGRGLVVVEAISNRWGYDRVSATLKVVWCELLIGPKYS
jgi:anti-sigma regulatory factor (Ser/Thr protein kinase)